MLPNVPEWGQRHVHTKMCGGGEPWARSRGSWGAWAEKAFAVSMATQEKPGGRK